METFLLLYPDFFAFGRTAALARILSTLQLRVVDVRLVMLNRGAIRKQRRNLFGVNFVPEILDLRERIETFGVSTVVQLRGSRDVVDALGVLHAFKQQRGGLRQCLGVNHPLIKFVHAPASREEFDRDMAIFSDLTRQLPNVDSFLPASERLNNYLETLSAAYSTARGFDSLDRCLDTVSERIHYSECNVLPKRMALLFLRRLRFANRARYDHFQHHLQMCGVSLPFWLHVTVNAYCLMPAVDNRDQIGRLQTLPSSSTAASVR